MTDLSRVTSRTLVSMIVDQLGGAIFDGTYEPGSQLPPEIELTDALGVSRPTIREALRQLEEQGLIVRRQGVGTFVKSPSILKNLNFNYGLSEMISHAGYVPGYADVEIREEPANEVVAKALKVEPYERTVVVELVRTADDRPVAYSVEIAPHSLIGEKLEDLKICENPSLYRFFEVELLMRIDHGVGRLSPVVADEKLANRLEVNQGEPLLHHEQVDYLDDEQPIIFSHAYHVADAFDVTIYRARRPGVASTHM